jgi:chitin disaccharide deacetylase
MNKRLIINADDLGRTAGINQGVFDAHRRGVVTSATMMVNYPSAADVPALSAANPGLGIGLHVALTGGVPALPRERVATLVDKAGLLPPKPDGLGNASPREVLDEARAQLARFRQIMKRDPTHFDSHHHSHREVPAVLEALVVLARETGLPVRAASPAVSERLRRDSIATTDRFVEEFFDETVTVEVLLRIVEEVEGTTELMCHPAVVDEELRSTSSYAEPRARELAVLTDRRVREAIDRAGVRLIHFGQL